MQPYNVVRENLEGRGTGDTAIEAAKFIDYPFGRFVIRIGLSAEGKFMGVTEVRVNKSLKGYHDVEHLYSSTEADR